MPLDQKAIIKQIDEILAKCQLTTASYLSLELTSTTVNVLFSAIQRLAPPNSVYIKNAKLYEVRLTQLDGMALAVDPLRGILQALRNDYQAGYLQSVVELVHADIFADFLDMAD
jgi:hypothetical protein